MEEKQSEYFKILRQLVNETEDAILFWVAFSEFREIQFIKNYSKFFNIIQTIRNAFSVALMIQLSKLIDKKGISIITTNDFLKKNPFLFEKKKEDTAKLNKTIGNILKNNSSIIERITMQRNKYHVHIDKHDIRNSAMKVFQDYKIELSEIDPFLNDLIKCLGELLNHQRNEKTQPFYDLPSEINIKNYLNDRNLIIHHLNTKKVFERIINNAT